MSNQIGLKKVVFAAVAAAGIAGAAERAVI